MNQLPLTCIAIDDEPLALELIRTYVSKIPGLNLLCTFEDAIMGAEYIESGGIDLVFLDINMPDISGLQLARSLKQAPMIILTTAYKQYAHEGFEISAVDYLVKPIEFHRFNRAIGKASILKNYKSSVQQAPEDEFFYVHSEYRMVKILYNDIEYIESMEDYIKIHLSKQKPVTSLLSLKKTIGRLPADQFLRIHRSFIVPLAKVKSIQNKKIQLSEALLPIGNSYLNVVKMKLAIKPFPF